MYARHYNTQQPPDEAAVLDDTDTITRSVAQQILMTVQAMAGDNYPLQWRLIRQIKDLFEHHLAWEDIRFILLMDAIGELRDEIRKSKGTSNPVGNHHT